MPRGAVSGGAARPEGPQLNDREVERTSSRRLDELEREVAHRLADVCRLWPFARYRELVHAIAATTLEYEGAATPRPRSGPDVPRADVERR